MYIIITKIGKHSPGLSHTLEKMGSKSKVLIIDDSEYIRVCLRILLTDNYQLFLASNGQEGIDIALKEIPDLILCDVVMPEVNGLTCCRELKRRLETSHIPVLMLTAKMDEVDVVIGLEAGADDYLSKPFNPKILKSKIANHIRNRVRLKQSFTKQFLIQEEDIEYYPGIPDNEMTFIALLTKFVEDNISDQNFKVCNLASFVNMSQATLYRKVKQLTTFSVIEFIRNIRLRKAAKLLKCQVYSIQEVSEMVGYNDIPTFRKHFIEFFGRNPSSYAR